MQLVMLQSSKMRQSTWIWVSWNRLVLPLCNIDTDKFTFGMLYSIHYPKFIEKRGGVCVRAQKMWVHQRMMRQDYRSSA